MLIIVFTESEPSNIIYNKLKEEMERLEFFGDSVINTAVIMNLYLKYQASLNEKEFDEKKIKLIKSNSLISKTEKFGLTSLLLKPKYEYTAKSAAKVDK